LIGPRHQYFTCTLRHIHNSTTRVTQHIVVAWYLVACNNEDVDDDDMRASYIVRIMNEDKIISYCVVLVVDVLLLVLVGVVTAVPLSRVYLGMERNHFN
jgi:hypothetical protein